jgi:hypothetical protein
VFKAMWRFLLVTFLLSGCTVLWPVVRPPIDIDCHDVSDAECDEAWAAAKDRFPPESDIEAGTVSRAGGAAECSPEPCADVFVVGLDLRDGHLRAISLVRQGDGEVVVSGVKDAIE